MFNVQCPGCSAPYQVDERRVPVGGLRMRCPKCATSFVVEKPAANLTDTDQTSKPQVPYRGAQQPRQPNPLKATMIGVASPALLIAGPEGQQASKSPSKSTLADPSDLPSPRRALGDLQAGNVAASNLPAIAIKGQPAPAPTDLPSVPRRKPAPPVRAAAPIESDLPAALTTRSKNQPRSPSAESNVALPSSKTFDAESPRSESSALPELAKEPPLVVPATLSSQDIDLDSPMPNRTAPSRVINEPRSIDIDLPLHKAPTSTGSKDKSKSAFRDDLEIDLPSPFEAMSQSDQSVSTGELDFDLPSPAPGAALPIAARNDLPTVPKAPLPAVSPGKIGLPATGKRRFGDVDLLPDIDLGNDPRLPIAAQRQQLPSSDLIPDLDAPLGLDARAPAATKDRAAEVTLDQAGLKLPDLTDALPIESSPPKGAAQGSLRPAVSASITSPTIRIGIRRVQAERGERVRRRCYEYG